MTLYALCVYRCPQRSEEDVGSPESGVADSCGLPAMAAGNSGHLKEQ